MYDFLNPVRNGTYVPSVTYGVTLKFNKHSEVSVSVTMIFISLL